MEEANGDRRHRRRRETIDEIVDVAVVLMAEHGAAGLSLGEVARRMGIRPPSLYVYFDSKNALYDAVFARGYEQLSDVMAPHWDDLVDEGDLPAALLRLGQAMTRWAVENRALAELMFWRPVPGYRPSAAAYEPSLVLMEQGRRLMLLLRDGGVLRPDVDLGEALRAWTVLLSGVMTQQLANAPDEPFAHGTFTADLPHLVQMFCTHYGPTRRRLPAPRGARRTAVRPDTS